MALDSVIAGRIGVGCLESWDWGRLSASLRTGSMDMVDVLRLGESLGGGVA